MEKDKENQNKKTFKDNVLSNQELKEASGGVGTEVEDDNIKPDAILLPEI